MPQAKDCHYGCDGWQNSNIIYNKLHKYWAIAAMRLGCAMDTEKKSLDVSFEPTQLICLAELLKQKCGLRSLQIYGSKSSPC